MTRGDKINIDARKMLGVLYECYCHYGKLNWFVNIENPMFDSTELPKQDRELAVNHLITKGLVGWTGAGGEMFELTEYGLATAEDEDAMTHALPVKTKAESISEAREERQTRFMVALYELSGAKLGQFVPVEELASAIDLSEDETIEISQFLYRFDMASTNGYYVQILSNGIVKVEDYLRKVRSTQPHESEEPETMVDAKKVFVVHGRNEHARTGIFTFLRALHLHPIEWEEAVELTNKGTPEITDVLEAAFSNCQAVIVVFTGDDLAHLQPHLLKDHDKDHERVPTPQPRPNVLFEAGYAFGRHPNRTILVEIGSIRPLSDTAGLHTVRFSGTPEHRKRLLSRLKNAKCAVIDSGEDWLSAGQDSFQAALASPMTS